MAGFTEQVLQKKLTEVNNTLPSIQTLSLWLLHHRKHSATVVKVWYLELKKEKEAKRLLNLVHLANDVIQNSRKKWPLFKEQFQEQLENAFAHVARHSDVKNVLSLRRVIDVWQQRAIFDEEFLSKLTYAVTSNLSKDLLVVFNENAARTPPPQTQQSKSQHKKSKHKLSKTDVIDSPVEKITKLLLPNATPSPTTSKPPVNVKNSEEIIAEAPTTEELLKFLKDLENTASADVETRERIAQFPADVADPSKLRHVASHLQAERFSSLVNEADGLLTTYNKRLEDEMTKRKVTLELLHKYVQAQKCIAEIQAEQLAVWKEKLSQLTGEMNDLHQHVESLPDLSKLPDFTKLPPLPSAGDLFMK